MSPETFADLYGQARRRVLTRYAEQARQHADRIRHQDDPALRAEAAGLDRYADACELAAEDLSVPTPEWDPAPHRAAC